MAPRPKSKSSPVRPTIIGCTERIALPELGIVGLDAKIDTGAYTTAIHATSIKEIEEDGLRYVTFHVPLRGTKPAHCRARLRGRKLVKNTGGVPERRYFIRTRMHLGTRSWPIDITLANRKNMRFALILGRMGIARHSVLVDPDHSFLAGDPVLGRSTILPETAHAEPPGENP